MLDILKSHYKSLSKFGVVGLANTAIDFLVFYFLYKYVGLDFLFAHVIAVSVALINSYTFNAIWTFKNLKRDALIKQASTFFLVGFVGLILSSITLYIFEPHTHILFAKVLAVLTSVVWNYTGSWLFVFKK